MQTSTNNTESNKDSTQETTSNNPNTGYESGDVPKEEESKVDDFGYEKDDENSEGEEKSDETPKEEKEDDKDKEEKDKEEKVEPTNTGYEEKQDAPKEDEKEGEEKEDDKDKEESEENQEELVKKAVEGLPDNFDKDKVSKFALENKLSKDQIEAYAEMVKQEQTEFEKAQETAVKKQRHEWQQELQNDPEFGGENFDNNVHRVQKLLEKHLPNTKKVLTERGSMLPPYIMRDFLAIDKAINPKPPLVNGEPSPPKEDKGNFLEDLYE